MDRQTKENSKEIEEKGRKEKKVWKV